MDANPWLQIPAADYESHMGQVGQSAALRELFAAVYTACRPARIAVLGCTTGSDLAMVDVGITEIAGGVDINPTFLEIALAVLCWHLFGDHPGTAA